MNQKNIVPLILIVLGFVGGYLLSTIQYQSQSQSIDHSNQSEKLDLYRAFYYMALMDKNEGASDILYRFAAYEYENLNFSECFLNANLSIFSYERALDLLDISLNYFEKIEKKDELINLTIASLKAKKQAIEKTNQAYYHFQNACLFYYLNDYDRGDIELEYYNKNIREAKKIVTEQELPILSKIEHILGIPIISPFNETQIVNL